MVYQDSDSVSFEIILELPCAHDYNITYLLHFRVIFFGAGEGFGDKIYWDLV
jgi:hypothetical protein